MLKLCLITNGNANNPKLWSGTPFRLKNLFTDDPDVELSCINYQLNRWYRSFWGRIIKHFPFVYGGSCDPWYFYGMERKLKRRLQKLPPQDFNLLVCTINVPSVPFKGEKYAIYCDNVAAVYSPYLPGKTWWRQYYEKFVISHDQTAIKAAQLIFTQNEWVREYYLNELHIPEDKVFNVGFGVNLQPFNGPKDYHAEELLIILRRGTEQYKGLNLLLDAFELLHKMRPQAKLSVVGTTSRAVPGVTYYEGFPREKTVELFQKATLYVMPALREPNGITYLEGLANRAPIVGLKRFALPEFSGNGQWGFMAEKADAQELAQVLNEALSDKGRLAQMGWAGQKFVTARYKWEKVAQQMKQIMINQLSV